MPVRAPEEFMDAYTHMDPLKALGLILMIIVVLLIIWLIPKIDLELNQNWIENAITLGILKLYFKLKQYVKKLDKKCRFRNICTYYSEESYTCNRSVDRSYCGKFRYLIKLSKELGL